MYMTYMLLVNMKIINLIYVEHLTSVFANINIVKELSTKHFLWIGLREKLVAVELTIQILQFLQSSTCELLLLGARQRDV